MPRTATSPETRGSGRADHRSAPKPAPKPPGAAASPEWPGSSERELARNPTVRRTGDPAGDHASSREVEDSDPLSSSERSGASWGTQKTNATDLEEGA